MKSEKKAVLIACFFLAARLQSNKTSNGIVAAAHDAIENHR